ncbi:MAG: PilZ domain-containing protein [Nitrospirae bacterium]|nr:PilZ domain-containing protein [Nitrospirota bacterium]
MGIITENRRSKRVNLSLFAELTLAEKSLNGFIENISEHGIMQRVFSDVEVHGFTPGNDVNVNFMLPSDDTIDLKCSIKWLNMNSQQFSEIIYNVGMEIIEPPNAYLKFVHDLYKHC